MALVLCCEIFYSLTWSLSKLVQNVPANHVGCPSCNSLRCFWNIRRKICRLIFAVQRLLLIEKEKIFLFEMQASDIVGRHNTEQLKTKIKESSRTNQSNCKDPSQQPLSSYALQTCLQFNEPFTPCNFTIPWKMTHRWNSPVWHGRMSFMGRIYIFFLIWGQNFLLLLQLQLATLKLWCPRLS